MLHDAESVQRIVILRDGQSMPMIPISRAAHLTAAIVPGVVVERHAFSALEVPQHSHPTHCLHLQTAGVSRVSWRSGVKSGTEKMHPGSLMLLGQGTSDSMIFMDESSRVVVSLDPLALANMTKADKGRGFDRLASRWRFEDRQLERLMRNLEAETIHGFPTGRLYSELLCLALYEYLVHHYSDGSSMQPPPPGALPARRLHRVLEYIAANLSRPVSLTEIATIADMSAYHFARLFKVSIGLSPHQYVLNQRIESAKQLLLSGEDSVIDVALACGFNDPSSFSKTFRKATGVTPTQYRVSCK